MATTDQTGHVRSSYDVRSPRSPVEPPARSAGAPETVDLATSLAAYRAMVVGRRFDIQATALAKQGSLSVYPSSYGQEACQVGVVLALRATDWFFPTYRDSVAVVTRGVDPVETLTLLTGDWHCGYDPMASRTAPHCTPLATQAPHAVGLALAARCVGDDTVALALCGDGATSEGDFHEALNLAAVRAAPVVFVVQNNGYAISVPFAKQTRATSLADRAAGYRMPGVRVDGNDLLAVHSAVTAAVDRARGGRGPTLIEAVTYRIAPHTNADDPSRYRDAAEVERWRGHDPIRRLAAHLRRHGVLDDDLQLRIDADAESFADRTRRGVRGRPAPDPADLFAHVYAAPTQQLAGQARQLAAEIAASAGPEETS
ncbi:thiamine pyrophosphate-dependent dehydrogenase E1 component subunit alpha [Micromonospora sp. NPDC005215]|uniref:thiamine pyrophosphate-dependent dehydrogenase E1 component subunit alpha n=1 Tax=Micromonospora sp. NPDC005215 TaxID=3157024 RepID=UPI0033B04337